MQKYYPAHMDPTLKVTTRIVWFVLALPPLGTAAAHWYLANRAAGDCSQTTPIAPAWIIAVITLFMGAVAYFTRGLAPRGFALNDIELVIDRAIRPVRIALHSITEVRRLDDAEMAGALRIIGASGFYGYYGWFWSGKLGKFRLYSGRFRDLVLLRSGKTVFVLGPEDTPEFTSDLRALLPH
ncbi:MAG: hypothetical protein A2234_08505 [Elusimicrobia bacterium RIFOXYA2_FULL_58_8]|nr:MAG: hypothetical protein A2234_08505 [Elusimicrobia bacterium RIFOXYA2_FULL_58_8]OGS12833.1 MAG: hypothetical protein A2285_03105 [Elusimicrobia bacterium RIFOXYA12_FULL_57_11]